MIDEQIEYLIKKYNEEFNKMKFPLGQLPLPKGRGLNGNV